jgi:hypothetical protein
MKIDFFYMDEISNRFKILEECENFKMPWLEVQTGIKAKRWHTIKARGDMRSSELEALQKVFPEYKVWLSTGEEYPEEGQISPSSKRTKCR